MKVIINRLKGILLNLISHFQSSFVPKRYIQDNIIIINEMIHSMNTKKGSKGFIAIKIDLEKAYDKIKWEFIIDILDENRIPCNLNRVSMQCISIASMNVL